MVHVAPTSPTAAVHVRAGADCAPEAAAAAAMRYALAVVSMVAVVCELAGGFRGGGGIRGSGGLRGGGGSVGADDAQMRGSSTMSRCLVISRTASASIASATTVVISPMSA